MRVAHATTTTFYSKLEQCGVTETDNIDGWDIKIKVIAMLENSSALCVKFHLKEDEK